MNDFQAALSPKSDQINAQDLLGGDMVITIAGVKITPGTEQPVSIRFDGSDKVWRPCKTTGRILMFAWGADTSIYVGRSVQLYLDPKVKWGGLEVGGIRIRALTNIDAEIRIPVAESKQVRKLAIIKPLIFDRKTLPQPDDAVRTEARAEARKGTEAFRAWFKANPDKRAEAQTIMESLKATCAESDAALSDDADPFGLPPIRPTEAELAAAMAEAEAAAREGGE